MLAIDFVSSHKVTSLPTYISAVSNIHLTLYGRPLPRSHLYKSVVLGLNKVYALTDAIKPKTAFTLSHLATWYHNMDMHTFNDARDWCSYILAFFGLLRVGEYITTTFQHRHVHIQSWGVAITIPFSKTCPQPVTIKIAKRKDILDPITAVNNYLHFIASTCRIPTSPFFVAHPNDTSPLSNTAFSTALKLRTLSVLRLDPREYAGHSFRRGGLTALFEAGVSESVSSAHGRWRSLCYRRYFDGNVAAPIATQQLAQANKAL